MKLPNDLMLIVFDYHHSHVRFERRQRLHAQLLHVHCMCLLKAIFSVTQTYNNDVKSIMYFLKNIRLQTIRLNDN